MASAPFGVLTPNWKGLKIFCIPSFSVWRRHLAVSLLQVLPIAIGLIPPSFFLRGISLAPAKKGASSLGACPLARIAITLVSLLLGSLNSFSTFVARRISRRCWTLRPSRPAAVPLGKDLIISSKSFLGKYHGCSLLGWNSSIEDKSSGRTCGEMAGCNRRSFSMVSGSFGLATS